MHQSNDEMIWFASYRNCHCTFVGAERADVPERCEHGNCSLFTPQLTANPMRVAHGMELAPTSVR